METQTEKTGMSTLDLNNISLEQSLIDFEIANARVVDLTARLTSLSRELLQVRTELATVKLRAASPPCVTPPYPVISGGDAVELQQLREVMGHLKASRVLRIACLFSANLRRVLS